MIPPIPNINYLRCTLPIVIVEKNNTTYSVTEASGVFNAPGERIRFLPFVFQIYSVSSRDISPYYIILTGHYGSHHQPSNTDDMELLQLFHERGKRRRF